MKNSLLLSATALLTMGAFAQTTHTEDFEDSSSATWTNQGDEEYQGFTSDYSCEGQSFYQNGYDGFQGAGKVRLLQSPTFQTDGTEVQWTFDYKVVDYDSNNATYADNFKIVMQYSTDNGNSWVDLYEINENNHVVSNDCATITQTIQDGVVPAGSLVLRFKSMHLQGDFNFYYDNISVTLTEPSCTSPIGFSATDITSSTVELSWNQNSLASEGYDIYYSTDSTAPNESTALDSTNSVSAASSDTSTTIEGLSQTTTYYAWIRSKCDETTKSTWSDRISFTTACGKQTVDYVENFDDQSFYAPIDSQCWTRAYGGSPATNYTSTNSEEWRAKKFLNDDGNTLSAAVRLLTTAVKDWLISPVFDLSGGNSYEVRFDYGVTEYFSQNSSGMGADDKVQFLISTDAGNSWSVAQTWSANNAPSNTSNTFVMDISSYNVEDVRFAFYATDGSQDDNFDYDFFIDNFSVIDTSSAATTNHEVNSLQVYPNPVSEVLTISNDEVISSIEIFDVNGRRLANKVVNTSSTTIDVSSYSSGTYFVKVLVDGKTSIQQVIVK